ncbi:MAG: response regulator transcription factor [Elusimicrobia bacterium]|nr:response regulator transcription factor [Elusimicrobiota bacterium]
MALSRIMIVEDHPDMYRLYDSQMRKGGHSTAMSYCLARNVAEARKLLSTRGIDIIVMDWMMPGMDGVSFVRELRADPERKDILIIMVTAKGMAADCAAALDAGVDDYLTKPFSFDVLFARIRSLARRKDRSFRNEGLLESAGIKLDTGRGVVTVGGREVRLHPKELVLLEVFLRRPGMLHPPRQLWDRGWAPDSENWEHTLVATIHNLKKGLGPKHGNRIKCARGLGYFLER